MTETIALLDRLISFNTVSENSNIHMVGFIESYLSERGFRTRRVASPCRKKAGLFAWTGPEGKGVLLSAHSDVVPVSGQSWSRDPFRLTETAARLYGRGATDMKGFLASMLALAGRAMGRTLREPLKLSVSYDEEIGCVGIADMIDTLPAVLGQPRACIVGEPTSMKVAVGHKGKVALHAACRGQGGHSALAPCLTNAIHLAADFIGELRGLQGWLVRHGAKDPGYRIPYSTVHVGKLASGLATNMVPELAEMRFEFRHLPADAPESVMARIQAAAENAVSRHRHRHPGAAIEIMQENSYPGIDVPASAEVVRFASSLSGTDAITKVDFGTEAGFFERLGIPTVVCGPGSMSDQGHKADEFISRAQLSACDAMMDRILGALT